MKRIISVLVTAVMIFTVHFSAPLRHRLRQRKHTAAQAKPFTRTQFKTLLKSLHTDQSGIY